MHKINLVLLLREPEVSRDLGRALWAAFCEVESFYGLDEPRAEFRNFYLSERPPADLVQQADGGLSLEAVWRFVERVCRLKPDRQQMLQLESVIQQEMGADWEGAKGKYTRTYRGKEISEAVGRVLSQRGHDGVPVVVTDQELAPPAGYRYIISEGTVISLAPTDPRYWNMSEVNRVGIVKHRVRSMCLGVVGELLGLERCENPSCFLYESVDSVMNLDEMVQLGQEHGLKALEDQGFDMLTDDPGTVQEVKLHPQSYEEIWYE